MQTFFSAQKSLGGHAKISITSLCLKIINFRLAVRRRQDRHINLYIFPLKLQAVAEKTANNFRGLLFAAPFANNVVSLLNYSVGYGRSSRYLDTNFAVFGVLAIQIAY